LAAIPDVGSGKNREQTSGREPASCSVIGFRLAAGLSCARDLQAKGRSPRLNCSPNHKQTQTLYSTHGQWIGETFLSGSFSPSWARPPRGGPRISSAAWLRLGCLLRGTTWPRLCNPSCLHLPPPTSQVLVCPLGGTSYWGHPLGESNAQSIGLVGCRGDSKSGLRTKWSWVLTWPNGPQQIPQFPVGYTQLRQPIEQGDPRGESASRSTGGLWWGGFPYVSGPLNAR
jgi:hypothetical protein